MSECILNTIFCDLEEEFSRLQECFQCLSQWRLSLDNAKRRAGACHPHKKLITVSRHHLTLNSHQTIKDTLYHEVAHAIVWERHREPGHGKRWKEVVAALGGRAKATGKFDTPDAPWILVHYDESNQSLKKLAERYRRNRSVVRYMLRGRPETQGQLYYLSRKDYMRWVDDPSVISTLVFHQ